jgi:Tfp pilus assembly protein PilF
MGKRQRFAVVALALCSGACAGAPFRGAEQGGRRWIEASSENFWLLTSQDEDDARDTLNELEATQAVFEQVAFPSSENPPGITEVVLLPAEDFDALHQAGAVNKVAVGYFGTSALDFAQHPRFVVSDGFGPAALTMFQHELTHRFVAFHFPNAPIWLNEGLAKFWETLEIKHGVAYFGGALHINYQPTAFDDLLRLDAKHFYDGDDVQIHANYSAAAALTRVLYFEHRAMFTRYLNTLKSGRRTASDAWNEATERDISDIRADFSAFFSKHGTQGELPAPPVSPRIDVFQLSDANVHLLWASLWPLHGETLARANREIETALALEPDSVDALTMGAFVAMKMAQRDRARAALERALELGPARSKVLIAALGYSLATGEELSTTNQVLAKRLQKFSLTAPQLNLVADYFGSVHQLDDAFRLITKAVRIDSSCFQCYATGSRLLAARGDLPGAVSAYRTALALAGERADDDDRKQLTELEAELARAKSAPAPTVQ